MIHDQTMDVDFSQFGVIIQARCSSTRRPRKVLADIHGQPMILRQLRRLKKSLAIPKLIVATSTESSDDDLENLCQGHGFHCFRGPLNNVMLRFIQCAKQYEIDNIIRVGGDDVLIDPECCNYLAEIQKSVPHDFLYASNRDGWPYGAAAELISLDSLERIYSETKNARHHQILTSYFFEYSNKFLMKRVSAPEEKKRPNYYLSVDYEEDLDLIRAIFEKLRMKGDYFSLDAVIKLMDSNPQLLKYNNHLHEGFHH